MGAEFIQNSTMNDIFTPRNIAIAGSYMLLFGLVFTLATLISMPTLNYLPVQAAAEQSLPIVEPKDPQIVTAPVSGHPKQIIVKSVGISLKVVNGYYNQKRHSWTLNDTVAQFAMPSREPNNFKGGTTFIYGHDTRAVFNRLHGIQKGAQAVVVTTNGYRFIYKFSDSVITTPFSVKEITAKSRRPRLSLSTCYGPTSADRQIFHFYLDRVEKA